MLLSDEGSHVSKTGTLHFTVKPFRDNQAEAVQAEVHDLVTALIAAFELDVDAIVAQVPAKAEAIRKAEQQ
jgi:hypothetical protein